MTSRESTAVKLPPSPPFLLEGVQDQRLTFPSEPPETMSCRLAKGVSATTPAMLGVQLRGVSHRRAHKRALSVDNMSSSLSPAALEAAAGHLLRGGRRHVLLLLCVSRHVVHFALNLLFSLQTLRRLAQVAGA